MNDKLHTRIDALQFFKDHPACVLKTVFLLCDSTTDVEKQLLLSKQLVYALLHTGATKIEIENDYPLSDAIIDEIFITVPDPLPTALLVELMNLQPDEFGEVEPNVFRLWWD